MKSLVLVIAGLMLFAASMEAEERGTHLQPETGYLASYPFSHDYLTAIRDILVREAAQSPAMMVTLPSFSSESVVFLESKDGKTYVVSAIATSQIWSAKERSTVGVRQKRRLLDENIAREICEVFALATSQSRYPKVAQHGLDGVTFHFSASIPGAGVRTGQTWSPDEKTPCGQLVALGVSLHGYARGEIPASQLLTEASELARILKSNS